MPILAKLYGMDKLFSANFEDTEVYDVTAVETENLRDNPPDGIVYAKNSENGTK